MESQTARVAWGEILNRDHAVPLSLVCFAVWLHAADSLLVATMIPAIVADIGGVNLISWTIALYQIGSIVAGAASGLLVKRYGLKKPLLGGVTVYALGCMLSALAPAMWIMLLGRQLQGFGGGALIAVSFVAVGQLFPSRLVPRALAAVSFIWGTSAFLGPLVGGLFVEYAHWRQGFWFFTLQSGLLWVWVAALNSARFERRESAVAGRFPLWRLGCLSLGVLLIAYSGIEVSTWPTLTFLGLGLACLFWFLRLDSRREQDRLLPKHPLGFANRVSAGLTMILGATMASIAIGVYGPLVLTLLHGSSALVAGYVIACSSVGWSIAAVAVSGFAERHDRRMILSAMGLLLLSIVGFIYSVPRGPVWLIAAFALLEGMSFGACWSFILRRMNALAAPGERQRIAAAMPTVQRFGYAAGAAYIGIVGNAAGLDRIPPTEVVERAAQLIFLACLPFALLALYAAYRFVAPVDR